MMNIDEPTNGVNEFRSKMYYRGHGIAQRHSIQCKKFPPTPRSKFTHTHLETHTFIVLPCLASTFQRFRSPRSALSQLEGFEEGFEELDMLDMAEGAAPTSCLPLEFDAVRCYAVMFESVLDMLLNFKKKLLLKIVEHIGIRYSPGPLNLFPNISAEQNLMNFVCFWFQRSRMSHFMERGTLWVMVLLEREI